jgi:hypothetical protein
MALHRTGEHPSTCEGQLDEAFTPIWVILDNNPKEGYTQWVEGVRSPGQDAQDVRPAHIPPKHPAWRIP